MKKILTIAILALVATTSYGQRSVKSYFRKDGTYVSGYTRSGSSSHSSYSGGSYSTSSSEEEKVEDKFENSNLKIDEDGFNVYISVLKYKGETISIQTLEKYIYDDITHVSAYSKKFDNIKDVSHKIDSKKLTQEETLSLVSEYGWYLKDGILSKEVYSKYSNSVTKLPAYLTHSFEIVKLK